ncbi:putative inactive purple acid phosphatase 29 [Glycine max]|nr:putative inactive purple acid phosphatase 29 [Glycine max]
MALRLRGKWVLIPFFWFCLIPFCFSQQKLRLRFGKNGEFKILQIADLHFANGKTTHCLDVLPSQYASCSDLNTTAFIQRIILSEKPNLIEAYMNGPVSQKEPAPGLAYFHIPLPEYASFDSSNFTGVKQEGISSASVNSGFFTTLVEAGDVKAVFTGHDHVNDFCGKLTGIHLCYAGGFGYHAYGKAGWSRRARVVLVSLEKTDNGRWEDVKSIKTWKRLDDQNLTGIDGQVLWSKSFGSKISLDSGILGATAGKNKMMALKNLHDAENMLVA